MNLRDALKAAHQHQRDLELINSMEGSFVNPAMTDALHSMKPCPFCGVSDWKIHFAVSNGFILNHSKECWIGGATLMHYPCNQIELWNERASTCDCDDEGLARRRCEGEG